MNTENLSPSQVADLISFMLEHGNQILRSRNLQAYQCPIPDDTVGVTRDALDTQRRALIYVDAVENYLGGHYLEDSSEEDVLLTDTGTVPELDEMIAIVAVSQNVKRLLPEELGADAIVDAVKFSLDSTNRRHGTVDYSALDHSNVEDMEHAARGIISTWWKEQLVVDAAVDSGTENPWEWLEQKNSRRGPRM